MRSSRLKSDGRRARSCLLVCATAGAALCGILYVVCRYGTAILESLGGSVATREQSRLVHTALHAKHLACALMVYVEQNDGRFPRPFRTPDDIKRVLPAAVVREHFVTLNPMGGSFTPNSWLEGRRADELPVGRAFVVFNETEAWPTGRRRVCGLSVHPRSCREWGLGPRSRPHPWSLWGGPTGIQTQRHYVVA